MSTFTGSDVTATVAATASTTTGNPAQTWKVFCPVDIELQSYIHEFKQTGTYTLKIDTVTFASAVVATAFSSATFTPAAPVVLTAGEHTFEMKLSAGSPAWSYQGYAVSTGPTITGTGADYIGWGTWKERVGSILCPPGALVFKVADGTRMSKVDPTGLSTALAAQTWDVTFDVAVTLLGILKRLYTPDTGYVLKVDGTTRATVPKSSGVDGSELTSMAFVPASPLALAAGAHTFKVEPSTSRQFSYRSGTGTAPSGDSHTTAWGAWSESSSNQVAARLFYTVAIGAPNVPTGLTPSGETGTQITLTWVAPATGDAPTGYDVRVDGGSSTDVGNVLTHDFTGLSAGTTYTLEVRAHNTAGSSAWVTVAASTIGPPGVPTNVVAVATSSTTITLTWEPPTTGSPPDSYEVQIDGGTPVDVGTLETHDFSGLTAGTVHTVAVRAVNSAGESAWVSRILAVASTLPPTRTPGRIYAIGAEERTYIVGPEDRTIRVPAEDRTYVITRGDQ